jgi:1,2-dihydroxy-3-keto-5-methylthiopentene dioxygenase
VATLRLEDGTIYKELEAIAHELSSLNIQIARWVVGDNPQLHDLLKQPQLSEDEKNQVLIALDRYFESLQPTAGYLSRDLIVLHPETPNLEALLAKFERIHTHADDEVRYILDGEGVFGFVCPDRSQVELTVEAEEYINVPAGTEHWFYLTSQCRIKAIRYFTGIEGWVPQYTGTEIHTKALYA